MDDSTSPLSLREAREEFRRSIENEKDLVKQEKLKEFLPYIDKALDIYDLNWFREKAVQTADAARALLNRQIEEREAKQREKVKWAKRLVLLWFLFIAAGGVLIWTGRQEVYVYLTRDGTQVISETYEGPATISSDKKIPVEFSYSKWTFGRQRVLRCILILSGLSVLVWLTVVKIGAAD